MLLSAEMRWFWRNSAPGDLEKWFVAADKHPYKAGGGKSRIDEYLYDPSQIDLGIKKRGGKPGVEVKGRVAGMFETVAIGHFNANVEVWCKWTSNSVDITSKPTIRMEKRRWLRKFDTSASLPVEVELDESEEPVRVPRPTLGCNVELTRLQFGGNETWWTLGFEAFGRLETACKDIQSVAMELTRRNPPELSSGLQTGYPEFISTYGAASGSR